MTGAPIHVGGQLTPRLIRQLNEHAEVAPPKPSILHPFKRREVNERAAEIVAAEWPVIEAKLRAADEKRRRKAAAARRQHRHVTEGLIRAQKAAQR